MTPTLGSLVSPQNHRGHRGVGTELGQQPDPGAPWASPPQGRLTPAGQAHTVGTPPHLPLPSHTEPPPPGGSPGSPGAGSRANPTLREQGLPFPPPAHTDVAFPLTCLPKISTPNLFLNLWHFSHPPPPSQAKAVPSSRFPRGQQAPRRTNPAAQWHGRAPHLWGEGSGVHPHAHRDTGSSGEG